MIPTWSSKHAKPRDDTPPRVLAALLTDDTERGGASQGPGFGGQGVAEEGQRGGQGPGHGRPEASRAVWD